MIGVQDLRKGTTFIDDDGNLYKVLEYQHVKQGRGNAVIKTKLRNIKTGSTTDKSFQSGGRVQDIRLDHQTVQYLYNDGETYHFMDTETYEQPALSKDLLGDQARFLKENVTVELSTYEGKPIEVELPTTVDLKVVETAPGFKGDTASGGGKPATLETGVVVTVPFFVSAGDTVRVDTRDGSYVTRV
ncbi:MAG: elongation factor P [Chloroflexi bacterium]|nr:elongation factor P [Chloroflexota bacterium]